MGYPEGTDSRPRRPHLVALDQVPGDGGAHRGEILQGEERQLFLPAETGQPAPGEDQVGLVGGAQVGQPVSQESSGVACRPGPDQSRGLVVSPGGVVQKTQGPAVVDDLQGIGQQLHVIEPVRRQQSLDDVLDAGTQNGQGDFTAPAPLGEGRKRFVDFNPLPEEIQDLIQAAPDGGHFGRDSVPERYLSAGDLAADVPAKLHPPEGLSQQIDGVGMGDGPVEVAEDGHPTGSGTGVAHENPADPRQGMRGVDPGRAPERKMGRHPHPGLVPVKTNEIILQVGPGAQPKSFSFRRVTKNVD